MIGRCELNSESVGHSSRAVMDVTSAVHPQSLLHDPFGVYNPHQVSITTAAWASAAFETDQRSEEAG